MKKTASRHAHRGIQHLRSCKSAAGYKMLGETKREIFWKAPAPRPGRRSGRLFAHARVLQCNIQCFGFRLGLKTQHNRENLPATPVG